MSERDLILKLFAQTKKHHKFLALSFLIYIPVTLLALSQPLIIGLAVDQGFITKDTDVLYRYAYLFLGVLVFHGILECTQLLLTQWIGQNIVKDLRQKLFDKAQNLKIAYFDKTPLGRVLTRIVNDVESFSELFSSGAVQIVGDLLFLSGTLIMLLLVDVKLSLSLLLVLPFLSIGISFFRRAMRSAFSDVRKVLSKLNSFFQEHLSGISTLQNFALVGESQDEHLRYNNEYMNVNKKAIFLDASIYSFVETMNYAAIAVVLMAGSFIQPGQGLQFGIMVAFIEALNRFFGPVRELSNRFAVFQSALVSGERIVEFLEEEEEVQGATPSEPLHLKESIEFKQVDFAYEGGHKALENISFTVKRHEKVALVGHTGAGKSTLTKLLTRFYEPTKGEILLDGQNIGKIDLGAIRPLFKVVPQEVFLFQGSIRENLSYGAESVSDDALWQALRVCQMETKIVESGGLDAEVQTRGLNFSMGERQLLVLARSLVLEPEVLILDEATSGIDPYTEKKLEKATDALLENRTAFIVAHRLRTIEKCDRILVFHKGMLAEQGSHSELLRKGGLYKKMLEIQQQEENILKRETPIEPLPLELNT